MAKKESKSVIDKAVNLHQIEMLSGRNIPIPQKLPSSQTKPTITADTDKSKNNRQ